VGQFFEKSADFSKDLLFLKNLEFAMTGTAHLSMQISRRLVQTAYYGQQPNRRRMA
jgi:hypothetical protein